MRLVTLSISAAVLLIAVPAAAQGWVHFADREELFSVNFPHEPMIAEISYHSEYHVELPAKVYTASDDRVSYEVTVVNYEDTQVVDVRGSIAYAAWNFRKRGGDITFDAYAQIDRSRTYVAIHLHKSRLYVLEATAPEGTPPPGHFQQSLSILDETGERIRYNLDADGVRTQVD
jgi:hypothetical protein